MLTHVFVYKNRALDFWVDSNNSLGVQSDGNKLLECRNLEFTCTTNHLLSVEIPTWKLHRKDEQVLSIMRIAVAL